MYRKLYRHITYFDNDLVKIALGILFLFFIFLVILAIRGDKTFTFWIVLDIFLIFAFLFFALVFKIISDVRRGVTRIASDVASLTIIKTLQHYGLEDHIVHFIEQWGLSNSNHVWKYKNYSFDWTRVDELKEYLVNKGVKVTEESLQTILKHYIEKKEQNVLNSITEYIPNNL